MIATLDTNVVVGVLEGEETLAERVALILDRLADQGPVLVAPAVYAELLAAPSRSPALVDAFLAQTPVRVDWSLEEAVWRAAGLAYRTYMQRRQAEAADAPLRRILADFIIGAHAVQRQATLLTWDEGIYHTYFPGLTTVAP
jgi:predicted nucleic acid-binding protein